MIALGPSTTSVLIGVVGQARQDAESLISNVNAFVRHLETHATEIVSVPAEVDLTKEWQSVNKVLSFPPFDDGVDYLVIRRSNHV